MQWNLVYIGSVAAAAAIWDGTNREREEERRPGRRRDEREGERAFAWLVRRGAPGGYRQRRECARVGVFWEFLVNNEGGTVAAAVVATQRARRRGLWGFFLSLLATPYMP
jgi:hypothetical protein